MSIRITGMNSGLDTDSMVKELVNAYEKQGQKYTKARTKTEWKQEAWKDLNGKIKSFYSKYASNMRFTDAYSKKKTTVSDSSKATVIADGKAVTGSQSLQISKLAKAGYLTGGKLEGVASDTKLSDLGITEETSLTINRGDGRTHEIKLNADMTVADFAAKIDSVSDMNASYDAANGRMFISSAASGRTNDFNFDGNTGAAATFLENMGLTKAAGAEKINGQDAEITLNNVKYTSASNTFAINGLTITAKATTAEDEELSLTTDSDVDGIYDSIKGFIKEYNALINELDKLYNAKDAKKFEPLTDEEKDAMSDTEVEKWEKTIKDSLLRRDSDIEKLASSMKNSMLKAFDVKVGGASIGTFSLSSFGIETLGYFESADNEKNALHIAGNADDEYRSADSDKLRSMIAANPQAVEGFFTQLIGGLYDSMNKIQSESDNYTTYGSFYSDKKLQSEYNDQDKQIAKWEKYVADIESKYYKQFTAMEKAMADLQKQQNSLGQLFGN